MEYFHHIISYRNKGEKFIICSKTPQKYIRTLIYRRCNNSRHFEIFYVEIGFYTSVTYQILCFLVEISVTVSIHTNRHSDIMVKIIIRLAMQFKNSRENSVAQEPSEEPQAAFSTSNVRLVNLIFFLTRVHFYIQLPNSPHKTGSTP